MSRKYTAWVGTNSVRNSLGIYSVSVEADTLRMEIVSTQKAYNTGALALSKDGKRLYAASEGMVFLGQASGGAMSYAIDGEGCLTPTGAVPTLGQRPCCLGLNEKTSQLYASNFFGGSLSMIDLDAEGAISGLGRLITEPRVPQWPHAMHAVAVADGGRSAAAINITQSELVLYDAGTGKRIASYCFGEKVFGRSVAVCGNYIYAMLQDPGILYAFRNRAYENGTLELLQTCPVIPGYDGFHGTSALRVSPDGKFVMAAVRRTNSISVFRIQPDGTLEFCSQNIVPGETPRDFMISPDSKLVLAAMQFSDQLQALWVDEQTGRLVPAGEELSIPSPAAVVIREEEHV